MTRHTSHKETETVPKMRWAEPALSVYGTVAEITGVCDEKTHGKSDGITLKAPSIQCAS